MNLLIITRAYSIYYTPGRGKIVPRNVIQSKLLFLKFFYVVTFFNCEKYYDYAHLIFAVLLKSTKQEHTLHISTYKNRRLWIRKYISQLTGKYMLGVQHLAINRVQDKIEHNTQQ